jgi:hypothetical protein
MIQRSNRRDGGRFKISMAAIPSFDIQRETGKK